ncbi:MAG: hypothetical protein CVT99_15450 [Bacteroidetes bacterium HGW-Bacteroidetes-16]|jgi:hypothetical protein|nr:MAG: hypothetical protein CVT99_15450 [Bacteroidetes bacterium HGW-Bacteroidetes-16]
MKRLTTLIIFTFIVLMAQSQENFVWDTIIDLQGTKDELFSKAKMVLAQDFNDADNVTRNTDKEAGAILIKAQETVFTHGWFDITYYFEYQLTILAKDGKLRVILKDTRNSKITKVGTQTVTVNGNVPVSSTYPATSEKEGKKEFGLDANKYFEVITPLHAKLQLIFAKIVTDLQKENIIEDEW